MLNQTVNKSPSAALFRSDRRPSKGGGEDVYSSSHRLAVGKFEGTKLMNRNPKEKIVNHSFRLSARAPNLWRVYLHADILAFFNYLVLWVRLTIGVPVTTQRRCAFRPHTAFAILVCGFRMV